MTAAARPHRHRPLLAYAVVPVALAVLGACTASDPGPTVTAPSSRPAVASSPAPTAITTSTAPSPTATVDPVIAKIPAAARPETQAGAAAFTKFFFEQLNRSFKDASPELLDGLFTSSCEICTDLSRSAKELKLASEHHDGDTLKVTFSSATIFNDHDRQVLVKLDQFAVPVVDENGKRVDTTRSGTGAFVAVLRFGTHWELTDLGRPS